MTELTGWTAWTACPLRRHLALFSPVKPGAGEIASALMRETQRLQQDIGTGLRLVWGNVTLATLALVGCVWNVATAGWTLILVVCAQHALAHLPRTIILKTLLTGNRWLPLSGAFSASIPSWVKHVYQEQGVQGVLGMPLSSSVLIGAIVAVGGVGAVLGPLLAVAASRRWGQQRAALVGAACSASCWILLGWATTPWALAGVALLLMGADQLFNTCQYTLRMQLIPPHSVGRMTGVFRLLLMGSQPLGVLLVGWLLQAYGIGATVWIMYGVLMGTTSLLATTLVRRSAC